jgi:asparagine synthase (glutamine-hydrolysing)
MIEGGRDRGLARRAFEQRLPAAVVHRCAKGRVDRHISKVLDRHLPFVRELVLDGMLVRHGLLVRAEVERYLSPGRTRSDLEYTQILFVHLCAEVWLRRWLDGTPRHKQPLGR